MPKYAKFLKGIISNKKKLEDFAIVSLNKECFAIIMPPKLKGPQGYFLVPCAIGNLSFDKALCDLALNINLMFYSIYKLGLQEPQPTSIFIQLANRTLTYP